MTNNIDLAALWQQPEALEAAYRQQPEAFRQAFEARFPEPSNDPLAAFWHARLNYQKPAAPSDRKELPVLLLFIFLAGCVVKLPSWLGIEPDLFYQKNIGFTVLPFLMGWFLWKHQVASKSWVLIGGILVVTATYINLLPKSIHPDAYNLALVHLPLLLWSVLGFAFGGGQWHNLLGRLQFLRFNGDLVVMGTLLVIACGILTGITYSLFELIGVNINYVFTHYLIIWGAPAVPILATYLVQQNPEIVNRISPLIARLFTPLVFVTLVVYLIAMMMQGKDPYNDREYLFIFNMVLLGVMALIFFSVAENSKSGFKFWQHLPLLGLALVTVLVNSVALSAIIFRIAEWGFTPNRIAVLGTNVLLFVHLVWLLYTLFVSSRKKSHYAPVEHAMAAYLPVYVGWTALMLFVLPWLAF
ncbi:MAG: hypothetical protein C0424_12145 [Sphingobacteriaceae bacterium]|nr:hypothetical protein [Sphingobacteriaceae bacterium]